MGAPPAGEEHPSGLVVRPWLQDEDLIGAARAAGGPRVVCRRHGSRELVLGRGSRPELELKVDAVLADAVPVFRRRGGGCAVLLDPGNLVFSLALPLPGIGGSRRAFAAISAELVRALAAFGIPGVERRGVSDLALGDRKIGGSAIYREKGLLYYSTTLLVAPDLAGMERWLAHPPREPDYRAGRGHGSFLGGIPALAGTEAAEDLAARFEVGRVLADLAR